MGRDIMANYCMRDIHTNQALYAVATVARTFEMREISKQILSSNASPTLSLDCPETQTAQDKMLNTFETGQSVTAEMNPTALTGIAYSQDDPHELHQFISFPYRPGSPDYCCISNQELISVQKHKYMHGQNFGKSRIKSNTRLTFMLLDQELILRN